MAMRIAKPLARSEDLVIEELEDEVLVYDSKNKQRALPGCGRGARLARLRRQPATCQRPRPTRSIWAPDVVTRALEELEALELLESQRARRSFTGANGNGNGITRRQLAMQVGEDRRRARAAAPLVYSINVTPAWRC